MSKSALILFSVFSFSLLLTPVLVVAQYFDSNQVVDFIWVRTFKFERQWLTTPNDLLLNAILPAIAIFAIFLGLLRTIRLFEGMGNMEYVIALIVMFSALFTGGIGYISALLAGLGHFSVWIFFILFIIGAILYSIGYVRKRSTLATILSSYKRSASDIEHKIKDTSDKRAKLVIDIEKTKDEKARLELVRKVAALEIRQDDLEEQRRELQKSLKDAATA